MTARADQEGRSDRISRSDEDRSSRHCGTSSRTGRRRQPTLPCALGVERLRSGYSSASPNHQVHDQENDPDEEKDPGDLGSHRRYAEQAERTGQEADEEE